MLGLVGHPVVEFDPVSRLSTTVGGVYPMFCAGSRVGRRQHLYRRVFALVGGLASSLGCSSQHIAGPDQQGGGMVLGATSGAVAGALTGFQLTSVAGPGAIAGAGLGAVAGGIKGAVRDSQLETELQLAREIDKEHDRVKVLALLRQHYDRRAALFPARDIFPADIFFFGDERTLSSQGASLVEGLARLNKERMPWSRLVVACYVQSADPSSSYARRLAETRARAISTAMIRAGIEPRRVEARAVIIDKPLAQDPADMPDRYSQAVELLVKDR